MIRQILDLSCPNVNVAGMTEKLVARVPPNYTEHTCNIVLRSMRSEALQSKVPTSEQSTTQDKANKSSHHKSIEM
eukprot:2052799-Amphidinium_carterae.1